MKKEDLRHLEGKDIGEVISFANKLFEENTEGKKKAHYIYNICLEKIPNIYSHKYAKGRGFLRRKIWEAAKEIRGNECDARKI